MFTKRHYEAIARAIKDARVNAVTGENVDRVTYVIEELGRLFARDNGRFKRERFEAACDWERD